MFSGWRNQGRATPCEECALCWQAHRALAKARRQHRHLALPKARRQHRHRALPKARRQHLYLALPKARRPRRSPLPPIFQQLHIIR